MYQLLREDSYFRRKQADEKTELESGARKADPAPLSLGDLQDR